MAIRFFSDPVRVLSIGRNPIQVLLIRSNPVRSGPGFVNPIRSDPIRPKFCLCPVSNMLAWDRLDKFGRFGLQDC